MPMKILHIISGDLWAGAEVQAFTLLTTLQKIEGIEVAAALMNEGELANRLRERNIPVTLLPENTLNPISIVAGLRQLMRSWQPDVVHTHRIKENILGSIANRLSRRAPCVRTVHGASEHAPKGLRQLHKHILNYLNRWTGIHLQQKLIAVSQDLAEKLASEYPREKIAVIENGVDIEAVRAQVHPVEFRDNAPSAKHIGIVGRLVPVKRVDIFLETAALLRQQHPEQDWRFHIFGDGPLHAVLNEQANQLKLTDITTFHGHRSDIIACIAALDALVMCSDHEGLPMTILETMVLGTPIVAHAVGGLPAVLSTYAKSKLVAQHDAHDYSTAVTSITETPPPTTTTNASSRFSARENAKRMIDLYLNVADSAFKRRGQTRTCGQR